jgi:hypothetical protein
MRASMMLGAFLLVSGTASAALAEEAACWQALAADEDGDGVVTAKEAAERLDQAFRRLDADGDGVITPQEHQNCLLDAGKMAGPAATPHRTQKKFATIDADGDGSVTLEEYVAAGEQAFAEAEQGAGDAELARYAASIGEQGSGIPDTNGDGRVSPMEAALDVLRTFALMDVDGDRQISRLEWATVTERPRFTRSFAAIDRNHDDRVTRAEFLAAGMADRPVSVWRHATLTLMPDIRTAQADRGGTAAGGSASQ